MKDANRGWGLSQNAVFTTSDGGQHWNEITPKNGWLPQGLLKGYFLDSQTAWLVQNNQEGLPQSTLFRTQDGGQTWQSSEVPFSPASLQFLNTRDGWAMGDRGAAAGSMAVDILKTTNGGSSWEKASSAGIETENQPGALPFGGDKNGMAFKDMENGWVGGFSPVAGQSYLYRTVDGGKTWARQDLPILPAYSQSYLSTYAPKFFNDRQGLLPVDLQIPDQNATRQKILFYITQDGGNTWQSTQGVPGFDAYVAASFQDIWVWYGKNLSVTHDGGASWTPIDPKINLRGNIDQIYFLDANTGWAISMDENGNTYLYRTQDGGNTWTALSPE